MMYDFLPEKIKIDGAKTKVESDGRPKISKME